MRSPHRHSLRRLCLPALLLAAVVAAAGPARAQFNGDPFDPFRAAYRSSTIPVSPRFGPGQARSVTPPGLGTVPGIGVPWDVTLSTPEFPGRGAGRFDRFGTDPLWIENDPYRRYDADFGRYYRPNAEADGQFAEAQQIRRDLYLEASRETDPQRRAELMRQYRDVSRRISLGMSPTASRASLNARAERQESSGVRRGTGGRDLDVPQSVRSYDDLVRWSRVVSREALRVGVVRPGSD